MPRGLGMHHVSPSSVPIALHEVIDEPRAQANRQRRREDVPWSTLRRLRGTPLGVGPHPQKGGRPMYVAVVDMEALARNWWALLLRGVVAILFGVFTFVEPGISLAALVLV